jgi:nucleoid-associated protein EbfC
VFGLKDLMQQAQGIQQKIADLQQELAQKTVVGSAGGDMVRVEANGAQEILSVTIEKELLTPDESELLEDLIVAAVNDALRRAKDLASEEMAKITAGIRLPGLG